MTAMGLRSGEAISSHRALIDLTVRMGRPYAESAYRQTYAALDTLRGRRATRTRLRPRAEETLAPQRRHTAADRLGEDVRHRRRPAPRPRPHAAGRGAVGSVVRTRPAEADGRPARVGDAALRSHRARCRRHIALARAAARYDGRRRDAMPRCRLRCRLRGTDVITFSVIAAGLIRDAILGIARADDARPFASRRGDRMNDGGHREHSGKRSERSTDSSRNEVVTKVRILLAPVESAPRRLRIPRCSLCPLWLAHAFRP